MINILLMLIYFAIIGYVIHRIMGKHGGTILHWTFVGGCGSGLGAALEWVTGKYNTTFAGAISLCLICTIVVELAIRRIEKHLFTCQRILSKGWFTQNNIDREYNIDPDDLCNYEDIDLE